jgi:hypothetical protein
MNKRHQPLPYLVPTGSPQHPLFHMTITSSQSGVTIEDDGILRCILQSVKLLLVERLHIANYIIRDDRHRKAKEPSIIYSPFHQTSNAQHIELKGFLLAQLWHTVRTESKDNWEPCDLTYNAAFNLWIYFRFSRVLYLQHLAEPVDGCTNNFTQKHQTTFVVQRFHANLSVQPTGSLSYSAFDDSSTRQSNLSLPSV